MALSWHACRFFQRTPVGSLYEKTRKAMPSASQSLSLRALLLLYRLPGCAFSRLLLGFTLPAADEAQSIRGIKRELPDGCFGLTRRIERDIDAPIARQFNDGSSRERALALFCGQFRVLLDRLLHFIGGQIVLRAERLGFNVHFGDS